MAETGHATLCEEIEPLEVRSMRRTFDKIADQPDFTTFVNWARDQARKYCERGHCATGTCRGHYDLTEWKVVEQTDTQFTCEFSGKVYCRCGR